MGGRLISPISKRGETEEGDRPGSEHACFMISGAGEARAITPLFWSLDIGSQWVKGKKFPWEQQVIYNKLAPENPRTAEMIFPLPK